MPGVITEKHVLWDVSLVVNSVDLSTDVRKLEFTATLTKHPASGMGTLKTYGMPGLQEISDIKCEFWQNYAASKIYAISYAAFIARTIFNVVAKAQSGAASATNPAWTIPVFIGEMPVISGEKGQEHMAPLTFAVGGEFSVAVA